MAHKLSLAFLTVFDIGPVEAIRVAGAAGYDMIGLRLLPATPEEAPYPLLTDNTVLAEVKAALADTGVKMGDVEIVRLKADTDVASFEPLLARGKELEARNVLVAGDDPVTSRMTENFARLCQLAAQYDLTADLEFMPWTKVPDLLAARGIVEAAGEPNGGVLIDALHFDRSFSRLEQVRALPASRVHYIQFCDGPAGYDRSVEGIIKVARGARLFPGEGGIDLVGLARAMPPDVTVSIEIPHRELAMTMSPLDRAKRAVLTTRRILKAAGRAVEGDPA